MSKPDPLHWDDVYPIALALKATHPEVTDPTAIDLHMLRDWVIQLDEFGDERDAMPVEWLEQIQVEWVELQ